jgi:hypothetical protein
MRRRRRPAAESILPEVAGGWEPGIAAAYRQAIERGAPADVAGLWVEVQAARNRARNGATSTDRRKIR